MLKLKSEIESFSKGRDYFVVFYNKNSFGRQTLSQSLELLDEIFGRYAYLYQNPVHRDILSRQGLYTHRLVLDDKLRKNRDWLLAVCDQ